MHPSTPIHWSLGDVLWVCPLHWYHTPSRLHAVVEEMRERGAPTLRGYRDPLTGAVLLREGCHRIRAAYALDLAPILVEIPWWRSSASLERARYVAFSHALPFERWILRPAPSSATIAA